MALPGAERALGATPPAFESVATKAEEPAQEILTSEILAWNEQQELLSLSNGQHIQLSYKKKQLASNLFKPGQEVHYTLKRDGISIKSFEIIPQAQANHFGNTRETQEPLTILLIMTALILCTGAVYAARR